MNKMLKPLAIAAISIAMLAPAKAETYIKTQSGHVWQPYNNIKTKLAEAASANQTSVQKELYKWCIAAEPRIAAIQDKLGQILK